MIKKIDLRIIKTKMSIKKAFLTLIKRKGYEHITVQDIANEALINRNTFYLHYVDKADLVNKLNNESLERIEQSLSKDTAIPQKISKDYFSVILNTMFQTIENDKEFFQIMLGDNIQTNFSRKLKEVLTNHIISGDKKVKIKMDKKEEIILEYMISGIIGVITFWVNHSEFDIKETADFLCEIQFANTMELLHL
ncbi:MAG: TetR/AcrR family transcriptional regulator [Clostridiaceae bacterium]